MKEIVQLSTKSMSFHHEGNPVDLIVQITQMGCESQLLRETVKHHHKKHSVL